MASLISNMLAPSACRRLESCRLVVPDMYITYHTIPHHNITRHCIALLYITLRDITLHPLHILVHLCICCPRTCKTLKSQYPSIYYVNVYNMYIFIYIIIRVEISGEPPCPLILLVQTSGLTLACYKMNNHHQKHPTTKWKPRVQGHQHRFATKCHAQGLYF